MKIENDIKLDFKDVLIRPERSTLSSRKEVQLEREFKFKHSKARWTGIPIIAANMDTTGTIEMHDVLSQHKMMTALHKHYDPDTLVKHYIRKHLSVTITKKQNTVMTWMVAVIVTTRIHASPICRLLSANSLRQQHHALASTAWVSPIPI
jgi:hypothetical protein